MQCQTLELWKKSNALIPRNHYIVRISWLCTNDDNGSSKREIDFQHENKIFKKTNTQRLISKSNQSMTVENIKQMINIAKCWNLTA